MIKRLNCGPHPNRALHKYVVRSLACDYGGVLLGSEILNCYSFKCRLTLNITDWCTSQSLTLHALSRSSVQSPYRMEVI